MVIIFSLVELKLVFVQCTCNSICKNDCKSKLCALKDKLKNECQKIYIY